MIRLTLKSRGNKAESLNYVDRLVSSVWSNADELAEYLEGMAVLVRGNCSLGVYAGTALQKVTLEQLED